MDKNSNPATLKMNDDERDSFAISFVCWALYDPQAKAYLESGITAQGLLDKYKDRPYIDTNTTNQ